MIRRLLARVSAAIVADDPLPVPSRLDLADRQAHSTHWLGRGDVDQFRADIEDAGVLTYAQVDDVVARYVAKRSHR